MENICSILYYIKLFKTLCLIQKKFISNTVFFRFFIRQLNFLQYEPMCIKLKMFDIFHPILCVIGGFLRGANFFLDKYPKTYISAKFDVFIRDVNVQLIFEHNFPANMAYRHGIACAQLLYTRTITLATLTGLLQMVRLHNIRVAKEYTGTVVFCMRDYVYHEFGQLGLILVKDMQPSPALSKRAFSTFYPDCCAMF